MLLGVIPSMMDSPARIPCTREKRLTFCKFPALPLSTKAVCPFCLCDSVTIHVKQRINPVSVFSDMMTGTITLYKSCQKTRCVLERVGSLACYPDIYSVYAFEGVQRCIPNLGNQESVIWRPSRKAYQCCRVIGFAIINTSGEVGAICCTSNQGRVGKCRERLARNWSELPWDTCSIEPFIFLAVADAERFRTAINCVQEMGFLSVNLNDMWEAM